MSDGLFDIVFRGDIAVGHTLPQVKQRMAALFKRDLAQIEPLFSGVPVPLKKSVDPASAEKYQKVLAQAGALVEIRPAGTLKAPAARKRPAPVAKSAPATEAEVAAAPPPADAGGGLSLAPVGGYLLTEQERQVQAPTPVAVAEIAIELRPLEGPLVDAEEIDRAEPIAVPDVQFDIADTGVELIEPEYREAPKVAAVADLAVELAPPGSDLGQEAKAPPPPPPDTSGIQLAD